MKFLHTLLLFIFASLQLHEQVTIGSGNKPNAGTLLDLKEFETAESVKCENYTMYIEYIENLKILNLAWKQLFRLINSDSRRIQQ